MSDVLDRAAATRLHRIGGTRLLQGMIELFLEHAPARLAAADAALAAGTLGEAERAWHSLKSSAGNLGAVRLQAAAGQAEAAAAAGDGAAAAAAGIAVKRECPVAEAALRCLWQELSDADDRGD